MVVFGGCKLRDGKREMLDDTWYIDLFDHEKLKWRCIKVETERPCSRYGHASEVIRNSLVVYGGCNFHAETQEKQVLGDMWLFSLLKKQWVRVALPESFSPKRTYAKMTANGDDLFVYGGKLCSREASGKNSAKVLKITFD